MMSQMDFKVVSHLAEQRAIGVPSRSEAAAEPSELGWELLGAGGAI